MNRHALVLLGLLIGAVCAMGCERNVVLEIRTPAQCCTAPGCMEPQCPLDGVRSIRTALERVDGTIDFVGCEPAPEGLCRYEDLQRYDFLPRVMQPADAIEIQIEGWTDEACGGTLSFTCDSLGDHTVDLATDATARVFCDCPL